MIAVSEFQELRPYLFSIAYRMLGSGSETEDVLQDAWLRSSAAPAEMRSPRAWLTTVVSRLCLDRLKSARAQREEYVGPWLPEPVPSSELPDIEQNAMRRESVTVAFLVLLETLSPAERAAFLLREVFDYDYREVAEIVESTETSARQLVHRAKAKLSEKRTRFEPTAEQHRELISRFMDAAQLGELAPLENYLAADVIHTADGGGKAAAAGRPMVGARAVAKLFVGLWKYAARARAADPGAWRVEWSEVNGERAMLIFSGGKLDTVFVFTVEDDRISRINAIRNPEKLEWISRSLQAKHRT